MGNRNSGRRPIPTKLKILRGNPGQRKLNTREAQPPDGEVLKPATLSDGAGEVWDRLAPVCVAMRTLTTADVDTFVTLCELQSTFTKAAKSKDDRELLRVGSEYSDGKGDVVVFIDNVLKLERETALALRSYYGMFGLEPSSRSKLMVPKQDEAPVSKWAAALK